MGRRFSPVYGVILADGGDSFQRHVTTCDGPLVVLLQHQCAFKRSDGWLVWEYLKDVGASLDLFFEALKRIGGVDLPPVSLRKDLIGH